MAPQRADLVLSANIPHRERNVLVLDRLDVEADGRDGGHDLAELQLVEDGGLFMVPFQGSPETGASKSVFISIVILSV